MPATEKADNTPSKASLYPENYLSPEYQRQAAEIELRRKTLELLRMEREEAKYQAEEDQKAKSREASIRMIEQQERDLAYRQTTCTHMKQWNKGPSVFGQRDSSKMPRFFCCNCFKTWIGFGDSEHPDGLPPYISQLMDMEIIGG